MLNSPRSNMSTSSYLLAVVALLFAPSLTSLASGQDINSAVSGSFTNSRTIDSGIGVITQMAFAPNDDSSLYVTTWNNGVIRYDYSEGGNISNPQQIISPAVDLGRNALRSLTFLDDPNPTFNPVANGSYGIAFHEDPVLGLVMYLSRALNNVNSETPRRPGLGSIVRVNDADGDGIWGGAGDLNQTIAENVLAAQWVHQIAQFAVHGNTLYIGFGSLTNNGGVDFDGDPTSSTIGEAAHTASVLFIEDLTLLSNDTTSTNVAWFDIGDNLNEPSDLLALRTDTNAFTSTDPSKLRVHSTGLRNPYGIAVSDAGELWITNNQGGATANQADELFQSSFQDDHGFNKASDVVGNWKDPANTNASAQAAQTAGYFQTTETPSALLEANTGATGLDFIRAPGNPFDGHIVVARSGNGEGQDAILVNPETGAIQQLIDGPFGQPTDALVDPFGDLLLATGFGQLAFIEVVDGVAEPVPFDGEVIGIDFASPEPAFGDDSSATPTAGSNFNAFDIQTADGATASFVGTLINLDGDSTSVGFSVTNNMGKSTGLTGIPGQPGPAPFDDATIGVDNYGGANVGNSSRADFGPLSADANLVLTFSGLDDSLSYQVSGGYLHTSANDNFNTTWEIDGQSATTVNTSGAQDAGYITLSNLTTDGSGNLEITVTKSVQLFIAGLTLTASSDAPETLLGDANCDGVVNFLDIAPFIALLSNNEFKAEADLDGSGDVDFLDIAPFIAALSGS